MRTTAWVLELRFSTLSDWHKGFDEQMRPYKTTDKRGSISKVTVDIVRQVVEKARGLKAKGKRLRLKKFTRMIKQEIDLSSKTVRDILIANDLYQPDTKQRQPAFYKSLCQRIPNGLLSLDGSDFLLWIDDQALKYNIELGVDAGSFCHTGFEVSRSETADSVINILEQHCKEFGLPLGVVYDHGSANLSAEVKTYLQDKNIEIVAAGPANPKGNGSDEGAFSQLKKTLGKIHLDTSTPEALGKSVLEAILAVYVKMRNQLALRRPRSSPLEQMHTPVSEAQRQHERQRLAEHVQSKEKKDNARPKLDRLHWVNKCHGLTPEPAELKRAEKCIQTYDLEAITKTEEAFLQAVNRDHNRSNLSYFFGILKNIQQKVDDQRYQDYCRRYYSYELLLENQRRQAEQQAREQEPGRMENIVDLAVAAIDLDSDAIKESSLKKCQEWVSELLSSRSYIQPVRKKLWEVIGNKKELNLGQKEQVSGLIEGIINQTAGV